MVHWPTGRQFSSSLEGSIHVFIWLAGLTIINVPAFNITIGVFYSTDLSLLIPSLYGTALNAFLFYAISDRIIGHFRHFGVAMLLEVMKLVLIVSIIESLFDIVYDKLFYRNDFSQAFEIIQGNLLLNVLFFTFPGFVFGIIKGWRLFLEPMPEKILIRDGTKKIYRAHNEVYLLESNGNYVNFHTKFGIILERTSLATAEQHLPEQFIRCHRSFIVNSSLVTKIAGNKLWIEGILVPIGRKYKGDFEKKIDSMI